MLVVKNGFQNKIFDLRNVLNPEESDCARSCPAGPHASSVFGPIIGLFYMKIMKFMKETCEFIKFKWKEKKLMNILEILQDHSISIEWRGSKKESASHPSLPLEGCRKWFQMNIQCIFNDLSNAKITIFKNSKIRKFHVSTLITSSAESKITKASRAWKVLDFIHTHGAKHSPSESAQGGNNGKPGGPPLCMAQAPLDRSFSH